MDKRTVAVIGSTGFIGSHLKELLQADGDYESVRLIVRHPMNTTHPKLHMKLVDFEDYESLKLAIDGCDAVFSAIGTTRKKVEGDMTAYRRVDYDIPVNAARACAETGVRHFLLVSSAGANAKAGFFYPKLKGEVEEALKKLNLPGLSIFRPSMLLGNRSESRPAEGIYQSVMKAVSPLLSGSWKKYKAIEAKDVAAAMIAAEKRSEPGVRVYEFEEMMALLK